MSRTQNPADPGTSTPADDIQSLRQQLAEEHLPYVDISALRRHRETMQRWPLLHELNEARRAALSETQPSLSTSADSRQA